MRRIERRDADRTSRRVLVGVGRRRVRRFSSAVQRGCRRASDGDAFPHRHRRRLLGQRAVSDGAGEDGGGGWEGGGVDGRAG